MSGKQSKKINESGAALVIALFVMTLLTGFVALALSRAVTESYITANDTVESRTFAAAEAALEDATRDFATVVEIKLNPGTADINTIINKPVPYFSATGYTFTKTITQIRTSSTVTQTKGQFQGLISMRDEWQIDVTAKETATGVETQVRRRFFNDRIPIFQFGAFYQDDLEVNDPPLFIFNGRIHTNGNFFVNSNGNDIRFKSKITVAGEIVRDRWKNGAALTTSETSNNVYAQNSTNVDTLLPVNRGSVTCGSGTGGILNDITGRNFPYPNCVKNTNWTSFAQSFEGNLTYHAKILSLPVYRLDVPLIEMIRRSKNIGDTANFNGIIKTISSDDDEDNGTLSRERFANKEGIRISLADSKAKLPQCANVVVACGVRLDGAVGSSIGYQPLAMTDGYTATALNGNRIAVQGREVWMKIELVNFDYDNQRPITKDVTQDILSLGLTEPVISSSTPSLLVTGYTATNDSRSIIKLQRFDIDGNAIPNATSTNYVTSKTINSKALNFVVRYQNVPATGAPGCLVTPFPCAAKDAFAASVTNSGGTSVSSDESAHYKVASFDGGSTRALIVPFPIQLFDAREGNRANSATGTTANTVYKNGVMSMVDIDVANLRRFLSGEFDGKLPTSTPFAQSNSGVGLKSSNVPNNRGYVVYFSDRRGDYDFDGRYEMEDVHPTSDSVVDEDLDNNGSIDTDYTNEAPNEDSEVDAGYAAVTDHKFYRRGVRLINGVSLPGIYDTAAPENTKGFTFASENGVYVQGNYNVSSVSVAGGTSSTTSDLYSPQNTTLHIPAAIMGDAVTILSNSWTDGRSFAYPYNLAMRPASDTQVRFAMLAGDPITGRSPEEGLNGSQNGGLINFKRFLESWTGDRLNYSGSLINLFNAQNSNGRHKPNGTTYNPPTRDWTFESSFTDVNRLPPGTPFVYYMTFTGFERVNE